MAIYSYIVAHDTGFAPNPFWGYCTLACCKPVIRRTARVGDWVVGLSPKSRGHRVVYVMEVAEVLSHGEYFGDARFRAKRPDYHAAEVVGKCGDNIYRPGGRGDYTQLRSMHSDGRKENPKRKAHDLGGRNVLISPRFWYFGSRAVALPKRFSGLVTGRGHRKVHDAGVLRSFIAFIERCDQGVTARPHRWPADDDSWESEGPCRLS